MDSIYSYRSFCSKEGIVVLLLFAAIIFFITKPSIFSPLSFEDEYKAVKIAHPELGFFDTYEKKEAYNDFYPFIKSHALLGRFYLLTMAEQWTMAKISNGNPLFIRFHVYLFAVFISFLFFVYLRLLKVSMPLAFLGACILFAGRYDEIWLYFTGEITGLLLLMASLVLFTIGIVRRKSRWNIAAYFTLALSALSKESFLILLPLVSLIYLLTYAWRNQKSYLIAFRETKKVHAVIAIIFVSLCAGLICVISLTEGGTYNSSSDFPRGLLLLANLKSFLLPVLLWVPVTALAASSLIMPNLLNKYSVALVCIGCLWVCSQLIVFKDILVFGFVRYLMPAQLFVISVSLLSIQQFMDIRWRKTAYFFAAVFALYFLYNAKNVYVNSSWFGSRAVAYHLMLDKVSELNPKGIAVIIDRKATYEFVEATAVYLSERGINAPVKYVSYQGEQHNRSGIQARYYASLKKDNHGVESEFGEITMDDLVISTSIDLVILGSPLEYSDIDMNDFDEQFYKMYSASQTFTNIAFKPIIKGDWQQVFTDDNPITYVFFSKI